MITLDPAQLQTMHVPAARSRRALLLFVVRTKNVAVSAALSERAAVLGHRGDAGRRRADLRVGRRRPADPGGGDRRVWIYCLVWMVVLDILKLASTGVVAARDTRHGAPAASLAG